VPFPQGRHVRPLNYEPMPPRAGDTAARGECCNSATPPSAVRLKAPRLRTASQSGAAAESSARRPKFWFGARRIRKEQPDASRVSSHSS